MRAACCGPVDDARREHRSVMIFALFARGLDPAKLQDRGPGPGGCCRRPMWKQRSRLQSRSTAPSSVHSGHASMPRPSPDDAKPPIPLRATQPRWLDTLSLSCGALHRREIRWRIRDGSRWMDETRTISSRALRWLSFQHDTGSLACSHSHSLPHRVLQRDHSVVGHVAPSLSIAKARSL